MVEIRSIKNTRESKWGLNWEKIQFDNGLWFDVEKNSYILAKFFDNGDWFIINKNSEFLKNY